jgi:hypothetical protein
VTETLANASGVACVLVALFAAPLLLGAYVVIQRSGALVQLAYFGFVLALLIGALALGVLGALLLG